jgi:hypothetical protein
MQRPVSLTRRLLKERLWKINSIRPMSEINIEQAIFAGQPAGGYRLLARSAGFLDEWQVEVERLCAGFGDPPVGVACPACMFARPFGKDLVAVVQVTDQGIAASRPRILIFRLLVIPRPFYFQWIGDPFVVADRFPPAWHPRGELPVLSWPAEPLPRRTVAEVQQVLQRVDGPEDSRVPQSPTLLGAAQALVDGGKLVFERPAPDADFLRSLWTLLPHNTRCQLWPASYAFGNSLGFDILMVPRARRRDFEGYLSEQQAGDYPEGRYELNLQIAAESGDQHELDRLFSRRSSAQTFRLGLVLVVVALVLLAIMKLLNLVFAPPPGKAPPVPGPVKLEGIRHG